MAIPVDFKPQLTALDASYFKAADIEISLLRLDESDTVISGNKWYKLKLNIEEALQKKYVQIISFGGAHSNHLYALAQYAQLEGLKAIGIVRGIHHATQETITMKACKAFGMKIHCISQAAYQQKNEPEFLKTIQEKWGHSFIIPEGGANEKGRKGCEEIAKFIPINTTHVGISVGTGTTFVGIINALPNTINNLGFAPMKNGSYLNAAVRFFIEANKTNWRIIDEFHLGGFGKIKPEVQAFIQDFESTFGIRLEGVYTAKMMWGLREMIAAQHFPRNSKIVCIHTGGLR